MTFKRFTKLVVSLACFACGFCIAPFARLVGLRKKPLCQVLYYHAVPSSSSSVFESQMDMLVASGFTPVGADHFGPLDSSRDCVAVTFDDALHSVIDQVLPIMQSRGLPFTIFVPSALVGCKPSWPIDPDSPDASESILSADEIRNLPEDLVTIGSHTRSHYQVSELDEQEAFAEIDGSRKELEEITGRPVELLSFPFGSYSSRDIALARKAGFRRVFLITPGRATLADDEYAVRRVCVTMEDTHLEFWLKLRGGYSWMRYASAIKHAILGRPVLDDPRMTEQ